MFDAPYIVELKLFDANVKDDQKKTLCRYYYLHFRPTDRRRTEKNYQTLSAHTAADRQYYDVFRSIAVTPKLLFQTQYIIVQQNTTSIFEVYRTTTITTKKKTAKQKFCLY